MEAQMDPKAPDIPPAEAPMAGLERALIDQYLRLNGYDPAALKQLPDESRDELLKQASVYASARLCEVESRWRYIDEIHHGADKLPKIGHD
jgi:hypothetical protein